MEHWSCYTKAAFIYISISTQRYAKEDLQLQIGRKVKLRLNVPNMFFKVFHKFSLIRKDKGKDKSTHLSLVAKKITVQYAMAKFNNSY